MGVGESGDGHAASGARPFAWAALALAAVVLVLFGGFLFGPAGRIPSHLLGDTANYFIAARSFGLEQLGQGNLPLWNPHTFSGTPFIGVFQSSLLYPLNVTYLVLPLDKAITLEFALSAYLVGAFTLAWLRGRGLDAPGAFFAAVAVVLGATFMLRILAGQLTVLHTLAWFPALLLCIDRLRERASLGWTLAGIASVSMMILACHPPTLLMAGFAAGVYVLASLLDAPRPMAFVARLLPIAVAPPFLAAVQLWPGLQVARQGSRQGAMPFDFATSYSFPPENFVTALVPHFFGEHVVAGGYFGRWFYWDASIHLGVVALLLAGYGALAARAEFRRAFAALAAFLVVLALGRYTPAYELFYTGIPGFALMRAPSKFLFFATLFLCALAGAGVSRLLAGEAIERSARRAALFAAAIALLLVALGVWAASANPYDSALLWLSRLEEYPELRGLDYWHELIRDGAFAAAGWATAAALAFWLAPKHRLAVWGLVGLGVLELILFARANIAGVDIDVQYRPSQNLRDVYVEAGDDRVLEGFRATNVALATRHFGVWGYDPMTLQRYKEFMAVTQGRHLEDLDNVGGLHPSNWHRLLRIVRARWLVTRGSRVLEREDVLPRWLVVRDFRVETDPVRILDAMLLPSFDPLVEVVLETEPDPSPEPIVAGAVVRPDRITLLDESTDHMAFEVELDRAGILLITDSYDEGWRAVALEGSAQQRYDVLPADYCIRAVPLSAGTHHFRVEYLPAAYTAGLWSSTVSGVALLGAFAWWAVRRGARGSRSAGAPS